LIDTSIFIARLLSTLSAVQSKLLHLESENGVSRRRVHELELELEVCKKEVVRERTRVLERDDVIFQQDVGLANINATRKGKASLGTDKTRGERYNEVVEEKAGK
jgi:hypothetical protein